MTLTTTNTNTLVERCRCGDQRAQMAIYNQYSKAMFNTAIRIVKDRAAAQDVMQESFLSAFTKIDSFKGDSTFGAWLKRIVVNNSLTVYKKEAKYNKVPFQDVEEKIDEPQSIGLREQDKNAKKVTKVLKTLNSLKSNYRIILTLHLIEGYDYEEIGDILNISYANCRTTVSRAKEQLRQKIDL